MRIKIFICLLLFSSSTFAQPMIDHYPHGAWIITVECSDSVSYGATQNCDVGASSNKNRMSLFKNSAARPSVEWHGDIAMLSYPCGTGCINDQFFKAPNHVDGYPLTVALDAKRLLVASLDRPGRVSIYRLFSRKKLASAKLSQNSDISSMVENVTFRNHSAMITYVDELGEKKKVRRIKW
jgi:hypothetical protein